MNINTNFFFNLEHFYWWSGDFYSENLIFFLELRAKFEPAEIRSKISSKFGKLWNEKTTETNNEDGKSVFKTTSQRVSLKRYHQIPRKMTIVSDIALAAFKLRKTILIEENLTPKFNKFDRNEGNDMKKVKRYANQTLKGDAFEQSSILTGQSKSVFHVSLKKICRTFCALLLKFNYLII